MALLGGLLGGPEREPAECLVKVGRGETEIVELYPFLTELTVQTSRTAAATATLVFESRRDEHGRWSVQDAGLFAPWEPIVIIAAFGSREETILRGYIRQIEAEYPEDPSAALVRVHAQDASLALDRTHQRRAWGTPELPLDDGTIVPMILTEHGLAPDPDNAGGLSGLELNQDGTDIRLLQARAEANGYELIFYPDTVYFGPMRLEAPAQPTVMVYAGSASNAYRFSVNSDGHQPDAVAYDRAEDTGSGTQSETVKPDLPSLGTTPADSSASGLPEFTWRLSRMGGVAEAELRARAQQRVNELSLRVHASGELDGSLYGHVLVPGLPVGVDGIGEWLGGIYYVDSVDHRFSLDGYRQSFGLLRNAYGDNLPAGGGDPLGALFGGSVSVSFG